MLNRYLLVSFSSYNVLLTLALCLGILNSGAQDYPPSTANLMTFTAGSYVIPMDNDKQAMNGEPFNLSAYGLVYSLLENGIPLNWVIKSGKAKDAIDFSALASRLYPTTSAQALLDFRASAFIIDSQYVNEIVSCGGTSNLHVNGVIEDYGNDVAVYTLGQDVTVDVHYQLTNTPVIAVLDDGGFADTGYNVLDYAGVPYDLLDYTTFSSNNACYTYITQPHLSAQNVTTNYVNIINNFVTGGGNFLAQCASINGFESNANFLSTQGFNYVGQTALGGNLNYDNNDMPIMQFHGLTNGYGVGSVSYFTLQTGSFQPYAYAGVWKNDASGDPSYILAAGDINGAALGGNVFYLAGHNFTPQTTITSQGSGTNSFDSDVIESYNINRMALNAAFVPANWVATCVSADRCICPGQSVTIGCSDVSNTTYSWAPSTGLSCSDCPNPVATPSVTTTYTATGQNGCSSNSMTVFVDCPIIIFTGDTICEGQCGTVSITADLTTTPTTLVIDGSSQPFTNSVSLCPTVTTGYLFKLIDDLGNIFSDSVYIVVHPAFLPEIINTGEHCAQDQATFSVAGLTSPTWTSTATLSCSSCASTGVDLVSTFTIGVSGTDSNGCAADTSVSYLVNPLPVVDVNDAEVCAGESITLTATGASTYNWLSLPYSSASISYVPDSTGTVVVVGTSANGCSSNASASVIVNPIISIVIQDEVFLCIYDSCITLTATNTSQVEWTEADGTFLSTALAIEVCPDVSTTYIAQTQDVGCYLPDSITVSIVLVPEIAARPDTSVCPGEPVQLYATGGASYIWTNAAGDLIVGMAPTVSAFSTQTYTVLGESSQGCIASDVVTVSILPMPVASFDVAAPNGYLSLLPINFTSTSVNAACWLWDFDDDQSSGSSGPLATHSFSAPGDYNVELMVCNEFGCWDSTYQIIRLTSEFYFYVPNTFTPDDDDLNSVFRVVGTNIAQENFEMIILNRWGEVIYEMQSPDDVWMGNHRSNSEYFVEDGVYIWHLKLQDKYSKQMHEARGHVLIVR